MKEELKIKIRKNVLNVILSKLNYDDEINFDDFVEDALMKYLKIDITQVASPFFDGENITVFNDINFCSYVYVFLDPTIKCKVKTGIDELVFNNQPFYVGRGEGERINQKLRNHLVNSRIEKIIKEGSQPIILKVREGLDKLQSAKLENYLIFAIGRADLGNGPLLNLCGGITFKDPSEFALEISNLNLEKNINSMILDALNKSKNIKQAAAKLGISERTIYRKIKDAKIERGPDRYYRYTK